jgi:hypothetical protein
MVGTHFESLAAVLTRYVEEAVGDGKSTSMKGGQ